MFHCNWRVVSSTTGPCAAVLGLKRTRSGTWYANAGKASPITIFSNDIKVAGQTEGMTLTIGRIERTFTLEEAFCECRSAKYSRNVLIWS